VTPRGLQLEDVVLLGRTFDEYRAYFALTDRELRGARVLDMGSGVSSFGVEARALGYDVVGADPIYGAEAEALERKCRADLDEVVRQLPAVQQNYVWGGFYRDIPDLARQRETAYRRFLADYRPVSDRFVRATLPETGFAARRFTLTLVSHFLFLYDDRFDYAFHKAGLLELGRITDGEIRIFPLANLRAEPSPHVERFIEDADRPRWRIEKRAVDFEFLKGSGEMLVIDTRAELD
jgi:hypothetical protein